MVTLTQSIEKNKRFPPKPLPKGIKDPELEFLIPDLAFNPCEKTEDTEENPHVVHVFSLF